MKKAIIMLGCSLVFFGQSLMAVEQFTVSEKPNNGILAQFYKCDDNRMVRIHDLGNSHFQFFSVGGKDVMEAKSALEVAKHVCKYYLRSR